MFIKSMTKAGILIIPIGSTETLTSLNFLFVTTMMTSLKRFAILIMIPQLALTNNSRLTTT